MTEAQITAVSTKQRLLEAAREIFAQKGFEPASISDICDRAGANRAAISFHFGGKERLYIETVKDAHRRIMEQVPMPEWAPGTPALERLDGFMRTMTFRMTQEAAPFCMMLMVREMAHPTGACEEIVREFIRPTADGLMAILGDLLPASVPDERRYLLGFSLVSQCLFYNQNRPIASLLMGEERFNSLDPERVAAHVCTVARAAVAAVAREYEDRPTESQS